MRGRYQTLKQISMKKVIILHLAIFYYLTSFAQWSNQISGTDEDLEAIQMVNNNIGYIVGAKGVILKTIDAGENWTPLTSTTTVHLKDLFFINSETGYVAGSYYNTVLGVSEGVLLKTVNGGLNWIDLNFTNEENLSHIFFLNSNIGFASCKSDGLFRTVDGGLNWTNINTTFTTSLFFPSNQIGYSLSGGGISRSTNGGLNWEQIKDGNSADYNNANVLESIFFTSESTGFFGSPYYWGIYSTTDGGLNLDFAEYQTHSIYFPSESIGYAITGSGFEYKIIQTLDSGLNWNEVYQSDLRLNDVFFNINSIGWAVGEQGVILHKKSNIVNTNNNTNLNNLVSVYPNPCNDIVNINIDDRIRIEKLSIYNNLGIINSEFKITKKCFHIGKLPSGVYTIKIETNKGIISKKIIKR